MKVILVCLMAIVASASAAAPFAAPGYLPREIENCETRPDLPHCRQHVYCPAYQRRDESGECVWLNCPFGYEGEFWPHCHRLQCPHGQIGYPPDNCHVPLPGPPPCPAGQVGYYPRCYVPCPQYQYRLNDTCVPVACPTGEGWTGKFQPDCKYQPFCPAGTEGVWPDCRRKYCAEGEVGNWPDCRKISRTCPADSEGDAPFCKCKKPLVGEPGKCHKKTNDEVPPTPTQGLTYLPPKPTTPKPTTPKPTTPKPTTPKPTTPKPTTPKPTTPKPTTPKPTTPKPTTPKPTTPKPTTTTRRVPTNGPTYLPPRRN